jgi:hypothetical protein
VVVTQSKKQQVEDVLGRRKRKGEKERKGQEIRRNKRS